MSNDKPFGFGSSQPTETVRIATASPLRVYVLFLRFSVRQSLTLGQHAIAFIAILD
ncbi:hypothetical protein I8751_01130 [Nostocaceae cyanobacterium CENA357]|uniref:Uncharacterized protein n=1 Tax=Atlanticothrix silvestris CENA357 TaxID=1725252 RepID=A0A8J7HDA9_9CYAN|nr:hypothetical protein [Atlanticothrix silvestris]MBH8551014.1 hypothetical protein [Atlanticothrix silvestris CENA357]